MRMTLRFFVLVVLSFCISFFQRQIVSGFEEGIPDDGHHKSSIYYPYQHKRLPKDVVPEQYSVSINPNMKGNLDFCGQVTIDLKCIHSTRYIILHSKNLNITSSSLYKLDNSFNQVDVFPMAKNSKLDQILFETQQKLVVGKRYRLWMTYRGKMFNSSTLNIKGGGLFRETYTIKSGDKRNIAFTFLGLEYARTVLPCFDEPEFKAKFVFTIKHDKALRALANAPLSERTASSADMVESTFHPTVRMGTTFLAFAITDYANVATTTTSGTKIRVWVRESRLKDAKSSLKPIKSFMTYIENYTGLKYPYTELNFMGINSTFGVKSLGLVIMGDYILTWNKTNIDETYEYLRQVALPNMVINQFMVTFNQWEELWLFEGLPGSLQYNALENYTNSWKSDTIACYTAEFGLSDDSKESSAPLNPNGTISTSEIINHINAADRKGGAMFYMLRKLLGEKAFKEGIRNFIKKYRFRNGEVSDLWKEFQLTGPSFDVKTVMHEWEYQSGYPLIDIKYVGKDTNGSRIYTASQSRYISGLDPKDTKYQKKYKGITWHVPLWYIDSSSPEKTNFIWMNKTSVNLTVRSCVKWIKANAGRAGFYRVNYDKEMWESFIKQLNDYPKVFAESDRYGLINDAFEFWKSKQLNINIPLKLTTYISKERSFCPFNIALKSLNEIGQKLMFRPRLLDKFRKYIILLLRESKFNNIWDEPGFQIHLLSKAFNTLAYYGEPTTISKSLDIINHWMKTGKHINKLYYTRQAVYETAIRYGNDTHWEFLQEQHKNVSGEKELYTFELKIERNRIFFGLSATRSKDTIHKWLNNSFNEETTPNKTDILDKLTKISRFSPGREVAWIYFKTNYDKILEKDASVNGNKTKSFLDFTKHFDEECQLEEVEQFARSKEKLWSLPATNASLKVIRSNIKWFKRNEQLIDDFLTEQVA